MGGRAAPGGNVSLVSGGVEALEVRRRMAEALGRPESPIVQAYQVHGAVVHEAADIVGASHPPEGDAVICRAGDDTLGLVVVADCLPIALAGSSGGVAAVHAGWRGLAAGVIEAAAAVLDQGGDNLLEAVIGPAVGPCCYEFGPDELEVVADRYGNAVRGLTRAGAASLDLVAGARRALADVGLTHVRTVGGCTSCEDGWFSWRRHRDTGRQGLLVAARL